MPKAGALKAGAKKGPKAHQLAVTFPNGTILKDTWKKEWKLGNKIGQGGFGLIYRASDNVSGPVSTNAEYVVKIEPSANGPLFCELHFYQRAAKETAITEWTKKKKLKYLPVPKLCGAGNYTYQSNSYRFLVMPRFSTDLQKLFESCSKSFPQKAVYSVGLRTLDALEFIHESDYVHADIKAANILMGFKDGKEISDQVYLVDYGLAFKYCIDGKHKEYKEDPRKAHDGTIEFTSRDAHNGVSPSRRGDIEILGYCLLQWLCGVLPWENNLSNKDYVGDSKSKYMKDIPVFMKKCFPSGNTPDTISSFLSAVSKLEYDEKPNYSQFKQILKQGLNKLGAKDEWKLNLPVDGASSNSPVKPSAAKSSPKVKGRKRKSDEISKPEETAAIKMPDNLTPAARLVFMKMNGMNGTGKSSPAKKISSPAKKKSSPATKKSSPAQSKSSAASKKTLSRAKKTISTSSSSESPSSESPSSVKRQKRETKTVNYNDSSATEEDEVMDKDESMEFSEDSDYDIPSSSKPTSSRSNTPKSVRSPTKRLKSSPVVSKLKSPKTSTSRSPAPSSGNKRMVRRKKASKGVDAAIQTSPATRGPRR